jgi:hypothetical protein
MVFEEFILVGNDRMGQLSLFWHNPSTRLYAVVFSGIKILCNPGSNRTTDMKEK